MTQKVSIVVFSWIIAVLDFILVMVNILSYTDILVLNLMSAVIPLVLEITIVGLCVFVAAKYKVVLKNHKIMYVFLILSVGLILMP